MLEEWKTNTFLELTIKVIKLYFQKYNLMLKIPKQVILD